MVTGLRSLFCRRELKDRRGTPNHRCGYSRVGATQFLLHNRYR